MARRVDVLVVGGGPAGLSTAHALASSGFETLLVERQATIGEHVRTSGVTALETAERLECPPELRHALRRLRVSTRAEDVVLESEAPRFCVLDVRGFYRWLAGRAERAGATVLTGATATGIRKRDSGFECIVRHGREDVVVAASVVVDASGYRAAISKDAGLHDGFDRFGVGAEYELSAPRVSQEEAVLVLDERVAPAGYAWAFPWGESRVRLGVGIHHADVRNNPRLQLRDLLASADRFRLDVTDAIVRETHFGLVPAQRRPERIVGDGMLAVGDAAGQATLVVGEGIRTAIRAGEIAGETIASALARGSVTRDALAAYERRFHRELGRDLRAGTIVNRRLSEFGDAEWSSSLRLLRSLPDDLVFDLLESHFPRRRLLTWLARHPGTAWRSRSLRRAVLAR